MQKKKAVFFDIDGTLWDFNRNIPESTIEAVRALRANGHLAFICSGRCRAHICDPNLLGIGFDGIVCACGTMAEYKGETLFYNRLDNALVERVIKVMRRYGVLPLLEGRVDVYFDTDEFKWNDFAGRLREELGDHVLSIRENWGKWEVSKFTCVMEHIDSEAFMAELSDAFDFMVHNGVIAELVPKGFHKGVGIEKVCEFLGMDISDTYAVGDGVNDLGMLRAAGTGIAMGNGSDVAKAAADYVTAPLDEDGIWKACRHFGLI